MFGNQIYPTGITFAIICSSERSQHCPAACVMGGGIPAGPMYLPMPA